MNKLFANKGSAQACGIPRVAAALIVLAIHSGAPSAFAQSGSTGGMLGKTDQSISGGQPKPGAAVESKRTKGAAPEAQKAGCARIAGSCTWSNGFKVVAHANGTATGHLGAVSDRATLTCAGGVYVFSWHGSGP